MYEIIGRVAFSRCGEDGRMKLPALVDAFQDCSMLEAEDLSMGLSLAGDLGGAWILASWNIEIHRRPVFAEKIVVATWPRSFDRFFGFRNYTMRTAGGELLAAADSCWIFFDFTKGKAVRIPDVVADAYQDLVGEGFPVESRSRKIREPKEMAEGPTFTAGPMDIDINHHVNNSRYLWMAGDLLALPWETGVLRVEYRNAVRAGEKVTLFSAEQGEKRTISLRGKEGSARVIMEAERG